MLAQSLTARAAGVQGRILARANSAFYGWALAGTAIRNQAWFSLTAWMAPTVTAAITGIDAEAWTPIRYSNAVFVEAERRWVCKR